MTTQISESDRPASKSQLSHSPALAPGTSPWAPLGPSEPLWASLWGRGSEGRARLLWLMRNMCRNGVWWDLTTLTDLSNQRQKDPISRRHQNPKSWFCWVENPTRISFRLVLDNHPPPPKYRCCLRTEMFLSAGQPACSDCPPLSQPHGRPWRSPATSWHEVVVRQMLEAQHRTRNERSALGFHCTGAGPPCLQLSDQHRASHCLQTLGSSGLFFWLTFGHLHH